MSDGDFQSFPFEEPEIFCHKDGGREKGSCRQRNYDVGVIATGIATSKVSANDGKSDNKQNTLRRARHPVTLTTHVNAEVQLGYPTLFLQ